MLLGARQFFEKRGAPTPPLPYDAEVEYLRSEGATQYIDTNFVPYFGTEYRCNFRQYGTNPVFAVACDDFSNYFGFGAVNTTSRYWRWYANSPIRNTSTVSDNDWHTSSLVISSTPPQILKLDDVEIATYTGGTSQMNAGKTLPLFGRKAYSGNMYLTDCMISYFSVLDATGIIHEIIPVRFTNEQSVSEGAMYDRVSGQLFRNAGTGAFTIGPDKS
jgi:hypothetical protein